MIRDYLRNTDDSDDRPHRAATDGLTEVAGWYSKSGPAAAMAKQRKELNWKHGDSVTNHVKPHGLPSEALADSFANAKAESSPRKAARATITSTRSRWYMSILVFITASLGLGLLSLVLYSSIRYQIEPKGCRMSYMRPSYIHLSDFDTEHTRFASKYSLYLYREQGIDDEKKLRGIPILFIPGNAGSYKQVRPLAAETASLFHDTLRDDGASIGAGVRSLDVFTVDFNEDITAFHGQTLLDQAEYLNEAVRYILSLYSDPQRAERDSHLPDPTSVVIIGHSMGGVVARAMLVQPNYQANSINTIITMSAPHARPPVTFDGEIVQIYDKINEYWRSAHAQRWANNNPLWHVTLISIAGGTLDTVVPSDYASVEPLVPETHGFTVFTTGIPTVWTSMDHQAILWCDQFRKVVAKTLYDIVDASRASQTKPRADRMRVFRRRLLPGMELTTEKTILLQEASHLLTLDDEASRIVPAGERFVLTGLGTDHKSIVHLLPVPPHDQTTLRRFSLLSDFPLSSIKDNNAPVEVLICSVFPSQPGSAHARLLSHADTSTGGAGPTKLACKNAGSDIVLLPASTATTKAPFYLAGEEEIKPFSYLEYDLEHLMESDFIAVVDKPNTRSDGFLIAEFSDRNVDIKDSPVSFIDVLFGVAITLPKDRPTSTHIQLPWIKSALLAFDLQLGTSGCEGRHQLFAPLIRQYLNEPYESKYFVNVSRVSISLHGQAPFVPPPLELIEKAEGLALQIWSDTTCTTTTVVIRLDILASLGKLYMRYRTVFAAFPLLIVTLVLRKQFRVHDQTGVFIPFSEALDLSLRRSIPLLLLSLTLLSASLGATSGGNSALFWSNRYADLFHRNELLIGTVDPLYCGLVPLIGIICIGVCALLHYVMLALTQSLGLIYGLISCSTPTEQIEEHQADAAQVLAPSTPRRRMISTAILLFLVSTFIPYQFAYLVACLVQLFTTVRASRISKTTISASNSNYYHYVHSVLLLMMWVLPINLPILAVWIRNLAVHWLTPFSSHHNVLSIMPFILLVENLTTGKMVPQVTSGLRHVTSILLFGTALCAAVYGVSHAYMLHYLVNIMAAWLVVLHSTSEDWSIAVIGSMFEGSADDTRKREKIYWLRPEK